MRHEPPAIVTARTIYNVASYDQYRAIHLAALAALRASDGVVVTPHDVVIGRQARINYGRWLVDCDCGAGAAADPTFADARCFYCGAIMPVVFPAPEDRQLIEGLLLARPVGNRHWRPFETRDDVARLNAEHGLRDVD